MKARTFCGTCSRPLPRKNPQSSSIFIARASRKMKLEIHKGGKKLHPESKRVWRGAGACYKSLFWHHKTARLSYTASNKNVSAPFQSPFFVVVVVVIFWCLFAVFSLPWKDWMLQQCLPKIKSWRKLGSFPICLDFRQSPDQDNKSRRKFQFPRPLDPSHWLTPRGEGRSVYNIPCTPR